MSIFAFLAAFLMIKRLQGALKPTPDYFKWKTPFIIGQWTVWVLYLLVASFEKQIAGFTGAALLFGFIKYADDQPDFKAFRTFLQSHYFLVGAVLINSIATLILSKELYRKYDDFFSIAIIAAFIWSLARWTNSQKQQMELLMASQRKAELEALVAERTAELVQQTTELQGTLQELKTTQAQLIQSEKMASLGELTAGIAHEIQNPLNFVNNFSEVSAELIDEMEIELEKGDIDEAKAIAADIKQNLSKITHHGKRADGIVKGMLQHSRATSDTKEPTDLNKLADEYLRLAYHGLRAKDKSFNAELVTHFDETLPPALMVPQDVGRVLLNLFTNAFYATQQRQRNGDSSYKPTVSVKTFAPLSGGWGVSVRDNGTGIPDEIREKIMQPFFTTKPTGEGTGLGLSLSYDIIVKGHGGHLQVNSEEGKFTEFIIELPKAVGSTV